MQPEHRRCIVMCFPSSFEPGQPNAIDRSIDWGGRWTDQQRRGPKQQQGEQFECAIPAHEQSHHARGHPAVITFTPKPSLTPKPRRAERGERHARSLPFTPNRLLARPLLSSLPIVAPALGLANQGVPGRDPNRLGAPKCLPPTPKPLARRWCVGYGWTAAASEPESPPTRPFAHSRSEWWLGGRRSNASKRPWPLGQAWGRWRPIDCGAGHSEPSESIGCGRLGLDRTDGSRWVQGGLEFVR